MSRLSRLLSRSIAVAGVALCALAPAQAAYPERTITVVCASGAGGAVDVTTRIITDHMAKTLGQNIVVQNEPGAGGTLAINQVSKAQPDGYTLLTIGPTVGTLKELFPKATVDVQRDLQPVTIIGQTPMVLVAHKDVPGHRLQVAARLHQGASGRTDIRQQRPRLGRPSRRLAVQENGGRRHPLHPLPHDAAGDRRPARRPHLDDLAVVARQSRRQRRGAGRSP